MSASRWRHSAGTKAAKMFSPRCSAAPSRMFSMTVMRLSAFVSWKVRTLPARATLAGETPFMEVPLKSHSPLWGLSKPVNRLKNVDFPAPFGPISAVME